MKKKYLFLTLVLPLGLLGQSVEIVPNSEKYDSNGIVYNNLLYFSKSGKLSQLSGIDITTLPTPIYNNEPLPGRIFGSIVIYNNKLCYSYDYYNPESPVFSYLNKDYIITYDGVNHHVVLNPEYVYAEGGILIEDGDSDFKPIEYNGKLILKSNGSSPSYSGSIRTNNLWSFDGQILTKINNPNINNVEPRYHGQSLGDWALVYNNDLYFGYDYINSYAKRVAKFDGTNITVFQDNHLYFAGIFNLANNLFFTGVSSGNGIVNYIPASNTFSLAASVSSMLSQVSYKPLIYNSKAYFSSEKGKLSVFDGAVLTQINNAASVDKGIAGRPMLFNNDIYFQYQGAGDKYFLGKYTPTNTTLSVIANLSPGDIGVGTSFKEFEGNLYFTYKKTGTSTSTTPSYLAKYDGQNITVLPNPDSGQGVQDSKFVVYGNDLYFPYKNAAGVTVLAKYGSTVLGTQDVKKKSKISVFKNSDVFSVISEDKEIRSIEVFDATGRVISNEEINKKNHNLSINNSGVFIIKVTLKDGEVYSQKIRN